MKSSHYKEPVCVGRLRGRPHGRCVLAFLPACCQRQVCIFFPHCTTIISVLKSHPGFNVVILTEMCNYLPVLGEERGELIVPSASATEGRNSLESVVLVISEENKHL